MSLVSIVERSPVGNPSITYKGSEAKLIELMPLIRTIGWVPGLPLLVTYRPAIRPCKACDILATGSSLIVLLFTLDTAPVTLVLF